MIKQSPWSQFKEAVLKEAQKRWPGAQLTRLEIWEPEGTYSYSRHRSPQEKLKTKPSRRRETARAK